MTTIATNELIWFSEQWENGIDNASRRQDAATQSGIVGDLAHRASGGYHISREDQSSDNYSIADFSDDRLGPSNAASAVDMTMRTPEMILVTRRLVDAWHRQDPKLDAVRGFNGTLDGEIAYRWDAAYANPSDCTVATDDHLWHVHLELYRKFVNDLKVLRDILSVILGTTNEDDDMNQAELMVSSRSGAASVGHVLLSTYDGIKLDLVPMATETVSQLKTVVTALNEIAALLKKQQPIKIDITAVDVAREIVKMVKDDG